MNTIIRILWISTFCFQFVASTRIGAQGSLIPPGPPGPTMKTLDQIEPRRLIGQLPFTITNAGSYAVSSNLQGVAGQHGILVLADNVTLDLQGFTLQGVPGALSGVACTNARAQIVVCNGQVRDWPGSGTDFTTARQVQVLSLRATSNGTHGIAIGDRAWVEGSAASGNSGIGILTGSAAVIKNCLVSLNIGAGISAGDGAHITDCTSESNAEGVRAGNGVQVRGSSARANLSHGFNLGASCRLNDCLAQGNQGSGITVTDTASLASCTAANNVLTGIAAGAGASVESCHATANLGIGVVVGFTSQVLNSRSRANGQSGINAADGTTVSDCTAQGNGGDGIVVAADCRVSRNHCHGNTSVLFSAGIHALGTKNVIEDNKVSANDRGLSLDTQGNFVARNTASNNSINYRITGLQTMGPILTTLTDPVTSKEPWANFEF